MKLRKKMGTQSNLCTHVNLRLNPSVCTHFNWRPNPSVWCAACAVTAPAVGAHASLDMTGRAVGAVARVSCDAGFGFAASSVWQDVVCEEQGWNATALQPCRQGEFMTDC